MFLRIFMVSPLGRDEWWLCQEQDCTKPDRASLLETRMWVHYWLQDLRTDAGKMWFLQDLVRRNISTVPFHLPHNAFIRKIEQLFISGRLHVHKKHREVRSGTGVEEQNVAFPLANHHPRIASEPAPIVDTPIFAPNVDMAAQAAVLMTAAASGAPFCQE
jgi:hypothetical protein